MTINKLSSELAVSAYDELNKQYVNGRIVNVTYHKTDWWKCFRPQISDSVFNEAIHGFCMAHPQHSAAEAIHNLQRMSDKHILEYADYYNAHKFDLHTAYSCGRIESRSLDRIDYLWG